MNGSIARLVNLVARSRRQASARPSDGHVADQAAGNEAERLPCTPATARRLAVPFHTLGAAMLASVFVMHEPARADEPIKLKFSTMLPASTTHYKAVILPWVEELKRRSNGRLSITMYPASSICKATQQYECVRDGLVDIAFGVPGWTPNRFPMTAVMELPFMHRTAATGSQMLADLWPKFLSKEYEDVHVLALNMQPAGHFHTASKPIRTLEDMKGAKLRTVTAVTGDLIEALGGVKVGIASPEVYQAMSNRAIDGFMLNYEGVLAFRLQEVSRYHTEVSAYSTVFATWMNRKTYEALPADLRQIVDQTTSAASGYWKQIGAAWDQNDANARQQLTQGRHEVIELTPAERQRWVAASKVIDEKWVADMEKRGLPGKLLVEEARALARRYGEGADAAAR